MQWILNKKRIRECLPITTKPNKIKDKANSLTGQTNRTIQISKELKQENRIKWCLLKAENHHLKNH